VISRRALARIVRYPTRANARVALKRYFTKSQNRVHAPGILKGDGRMDMVLYIETGGLQCVGLAEQRVVSERS
jgi:hypothetical protein